MRLVCTPLPPVLVGYTRSAHVPHTATAGLPVALHTRLVLPVCTVGFTRLRGYYGYRITGLVVGLPHHVGYTFGCLHRLHCVPVLRLHYVHTTPRTRAGSFCRATARIAVPMPTVTLLPHGLICGLPVTRGYTVLRTTTFFYWLDYTAHCGYGCTLLHTTAVLRLVHAFQLPHTVLRHTPFFTWLPGSHTRSRLLRFYTLFAPRSCCVRSPAVTYHRLLRLRMPDAHTFTYVPGYTCRLPVHVLDFAVPRTHGWLHAHVYTCRGSHTPRGLHTPHLPFILRSRVGGWVTYAVRGLPRAVALLHTVLRLRAVLVVTYAQVLFTAFRLHYRFWLGLHTACGFTGSCTHLPFPFTFIRYVCHVPLLPAVATPPLLVAVTTTVPALVTFTTTARYYAVGYLPVLYVYHYHTVGYGYTARFYVTHGWFAAGLHVLRVYTFAFCRSGLRSGCSHVLVCITARCLRFCVLCWLPFCLRFIFACCVLWVRTRLRLVCYRSTVVLRFGCYAVTFGCVLYAAFVHVRYVWLVRLVLFPARCLFLPQFPWFSSTVGYGCCLTLPTVAAPWMRFCVRSRLRHTFCRFYRTHFAFWLHTFCVYTPRCRAFTARTYTGYTRTTRTHGLRLPLRLLRCHAYRTVYYHHHWFWFTCRFTTVVYRSPRTPHAPFCLPFGCAGYVHHTIPFTCRCCRTLPRTLHRVTCGLHIRTGSGYVGYGLPHTTGYRVWFGLRYHTYTAYGLPHTHAATHVWFCLPLPRYGSFLTHTLVWFTDYHRCLPCTTPAIYRSFAVHTRARRSGCRYVCRFRCPFTRFAVRLRSSAAVAVGLFTARATTPHLPLRFTAVTYV